MNAKQVQKMAKKDAARWLPAHHLQNEIANKIERLSGYGEAFDATFSKLEAKALPVHLKKMNKLRDRLDKMQAKKTGARGVLLVAGAYLVLNQTGYDKVLFEEAKKLKGRVEDALARNKVNGKHEAQHAGA